MLEGYAAEPDDIADDAYELVGCHLPDGQDVLDVHTDDGVAAAGLPATYPTGGDGTRVPHDVCQPIGEQAYNGGADGVDCRSAATLDGRGRESAWWPRGRAPSPAGDGRRVPYGRWRTPHATDAAALLKPASTTRPAGRRVTI